MTDKRKLQLNKLVNRAFRMENPDIFMDKAPSIDFLESFLFLETNMVIANNTNTQEEYNYVMNRLSGKLGELARYN